MPQQDINPSSHKQFEIWELSQVLGREYPVQFVLIVSRTQGPLYSKEPFVAVVPLYSEQNIPPYNKHLSFQHIRGGSGSMHNLPYSVVVGTTGIFTTMKQNLVRRVSPSIQPGYQKNIMLQLAERFPFGG